MKRSNPPAKMADPPRHPWVTLIAILLTSFMGTWDGAAPVVALPAIVREYAVGIDSAVWVMTASSLLFAVPMAAFGKLADMLGQKRMYLVGASAYILFALCAVAAPSFGWLILFRALQGLASAPTFTATMSFIATTFPVERRGRAMGLMNMVSSLAWASGPVLGGILMELFNWKAIILVEIPLGVIAIAAAWRLMPAQAPTAVWPFDVVGAATLTFSALVLMFGLHLVADWGWTGWPTMVAAVSFISLLGLFILTETRHSRPFLPLSLFRNAHFSAATAFSAAQMIAMYGMALLVPVFLQEAGGVEPAAAGAAVAGLSIARVFFEPIAGRVAELRGTRFPALIGVGLVTIISSSFALSAMRPLPLGLVFAGMFLFGVGIALGRTPVFAAVTQVVSRESLGLALGVFSMLTFTGGALGQSLFATLLRTFSGAGSAPLSMVPLSDLLQAFGFTFAGVFGVAVLIGLLALRLPGQQTHAEPVSQGS